MCLGVISKERYVMKKSFMVTAMALCVITAAHADLLLEEDFTYSDGNVTNVAVPPWAVNSGSGGRFTISSGQLVKSSSSGETIGRTFTGTTTGSDYYFSFSLNFSSLAGSGLNRFFGGLENGTAARLVIGATSDGATSGGYFLGLGGNFTALNGVGTTELSLDTVYNVVGYYSNDDGSSKLWINPTAETDPTYYTTTASSTAGTDAFFFRASSTGGNAAFDNLLVGESFADVTAIPEPATLGFMGIGLLAVFFARRRFKA